MPATETPLTADLLDSLVSDATAELITRLGLPDDDVEHLQKVLDDLRDRVRIGADNHPDTLTIGAVMLVLNATADAAIAEWELDDEGERDAVNLIVNVAGNSLRHGVLADFDAVAGDNYEIDDEDRQDAGSALNVILGWIHSGL